MAYRPGTNVKLHNGTPIPEEMDFFWPAPPEIGPLIEAESTLTREMDVSPLWKRIGWFLLCVLAAGFLGGIFGHVVMSGADPRDPYWGLRCGMQGGGVIGFLLGCVVLIGTSFRHTCTYIGEFGGAWGKLNGSRRREPHGKYFLFSSATDLFTQQTDFYDHGSYKNTEYRYVWRDAKGKEVCRFSGAYNRTAPHLDWIFVHALEMAWSHLQLEAIREQFEEHGLVQFKVNAKDFVVVGPDYLEFAFGGTTQRLTMDEIAKIELENGVFNIRSKDAKWYSGKGKFSFKYSQMANVRVFLFAVEKLCGVNFAKEHT